MKRKPFAAFGRVLYANYYDTDEVVEVLFRSDSKVVLFVSQGHLIGVDKYSRLLTMETKAGWFAYGDHKDGEHLFTAYEPSVCWCYDPEINRGYVPPISTFILKQGQSVVMDANTNLFLCGGTALVNERQLSGPYQLAIRTDGNKITALTDVYGLVFG